MALKLRQVAYNVQYKTYFMMYEWNITCRLNLTRKYKGMSLLRYYERFKSIADTENSVNIKLGIGKGMKDFAKES